MQKLEITPELDNLKQVRDFITDSAHLADLSSEKTGELLLAVDEAVTNIIMHGGTDATQHIEIETQASPDSLSIRILDYGRQFDPTAAVEPDLDVPPLERAKPGGYGISLLRSLVDQVNYQFQADGRNELTLSKHRD